MLISKYKRGYPYIDTVYNYLEGADKRLGQMGVPIFLHVSRYGQNL